MPSFAHFSDSSCGPNVMATHLIYVQSADTCTRCTRLRTRHEPKCIDLKNRPKMPFGKLRERRPLPILALRTQRRHD